VINNICFQQLIFICAIDLFAVKFVSEGGVIVSIGNTGIGLHMGKAVFDFLVGENSA